MDQFLTYPTGGLDKQKHLHVENMTNIHYLKCKLAISY